MYAMEQPKPIVPARVHSIEDLIGPEAVKETTSDELVGTTLGANGTVPLNKALRVSPLSTAHMPLPELRKIASKFADLIPDHKFSPAEVQGFLLTRKTDPHKALAEVGNWRDSLLENKASKTKVLAVQ
jgi:hypothetical protein